MSTVWGLLPHHHGAWLPQQIVKAILGRLVVPWEGWEALDLSLGSYAFLLDHGPIPYLVALIVSPI